ncbi:hypothetical protein BaRGS_00025388 [Batillaria attramentaria]|uniref:Uncharacterized protein n=1 Tax=Batillaria attramentaria TaxID=370345 RepID=A0ABD0K8Q4_9CAEN
MSSDSPDNASLLEKCTALYRKYSRMMAVRPVAGKGARSPQCLVYFSLENHASFLLSCWGATFGRKSHDTSFSVLSVFIAVCTLPADTPCHQSS